MKNVTNGRFRRRQTNRDRLYSLCTYDLLCQINNGLSELPDNDVCIVDALTNGNYPHSEHCHQGECDRCILQYLDKEI